MKKIIVLLLILPFTLAGLAQLKDSTNLKARENYLQKSKNSKTTGLIMLGGGAVLTITGAILFDEGWNDAGGDTQVEAGAIMFVVGGLSVLGSAFPLIQSGIYKNKAMKLNTGIDMESAMPVGAYKTSYYPALSIKISLK